MLGGRGDGVNKNEETVSLSGRSECPSTRAKLGGGRYTRGRRRGHSRQRGVGEKKRKVRVQRLGEKKKIKGSIPGKLVRKGQV